ncbi:hypothetical protein OIU77_024787, partial [Salix suchowensis]
MNKQPCKFSEQSWVQMICVLRMLLLGLSILNLRLLNSKKLHEMALRSLMHQLLARATYPSR